MSIVANDLSLHLSGFDLLRNIDLTIEAGKVNVLVGPNGAGKSSFVACVNR
jgi:iron complex transport system ATP-binding protein